MQPRHATAAALLAAVLSAAAAPVLAWGPYTHQAFGRLQQRASPAGVPIPSSAAFVAGASSPDAFKGAAPALHSLPFAAALHTAATASGDADLHAFALGFGCHLAQDAVGHHGHGYLNPAEDHPLEFAVDSYVQKNEPGSGGGTLQQISDAQAALVANASVVYAHSSGDPSAALTMAQASKSVSSFELLTTAEAAAIAVNFLYKSEMVKYDACGAKDFAATLANYEVSRGWVLDACDRWVHLMAEGVEGGTASANVSAYVDSLFAAHGGTTCASQQDRSRATGSHASASSSNGGAAACGPHDNPAECAALAEFGAALSYEAWTSNTNWLRGGVSVCDWFGVTCDAATGRVIGLSLPKNMLNGTVPASIASLTMLQNFTISGNRPPSYHGCVNTDLRHSSLPDTFWTLTELRHTAWEYSCMEGTIPDAVSNLRNLVEASWHTNHLHGTIPLALDNLPLQILKLGRNPLTGSLPNFRNLTQLQHFSCNFCALSGEFPPSVLAGMPQLVNSFWDGNNFEGALPTAFPQSLQRTSFNINSFSGAVPDALCTLPALWDCRIGADTDLAPYQADYPWVKPVKGNVYACGELPACARSGAICNSTHDAGKDQVNSPVRCR